MDIRVGQAKEGLVEVIRKRGSSVLIRPLNRVKAKWIRTREVRKVLNPERGVNLRMAKDVDFDQDCGCTAVVEFLSSGRIETFNVYGDLESYLISRVREGSGLSEHHRRKHLREVGFLRGRGLRRRLRRRDEGRKIRQYERNGYDIV